MDITTLFLKYIISNYWAFRKHDVERNVLCMLFVVLQRRAQAVVARCGARQSVTCLRGWPLSPLSLARALPRCIRSRHRRHNSIPLGIFYSLSNFLPTSSYHVTRHNKSYTAIDICDATNNPIRFA